MTPVSPANGGDPRRVARGVQPVVNRGPDFPPLHRRSAGAGVARDQQQHSVPRGYRTLQAEVGRAPRPLEAQSVEVEHPVGLDGARPQAAVPVRIERRGWRRARRRALRRRRPWDDLRAVRPAFGPLPGVPVVKRFAGKRPDRRRDPRPKLMFFSAERTHGLPRPWGSGPAPGPWPTSRPRSAERLRPRPRRCRPGSRP